LKIPRDSGPPSNDRVERGARVTTPSPGTPGLLEPGDRGPEVGPIDVGIPSPVLRPVENLEQPELPPRLALAGESANLARPKPGVGRKGERQLPRQRRDRADLLDLLPGERPENLTPDRGQLPELGKLGEMPRLVGPRRRPRAVFDLRRQR